MAFSNEQHRKRYAEDPKHREKKLADNRVYRAEHRERLNALWLERWRSNPAYRERRRLARLKRLYGLSAERYRREIREIFQVTELLAELGDDPRRHDLELKVWVAENRAQVLLTKLATPNEEERKKVELWAEAMLRLVSENSADLSFYLKVVSDNTTVPVIITDAQGAVKFHRNLEDRVAKDTALLHAELKAMAALARIGLSISPAAGYSAPAATGIPITLYMKAQNRFCFVVRIVARDSRMADATLRRSPRMSVTSLASIAISVPVPMAIPTSARDRAGASLMPSPTIATTSPSLRSRSISAILPSGRRPAATRSTPTSRATVWAVCS